MLVIIGVKPCRRHRRARTPPLITAATEVVFSSTLVCLFACFLVGLRKKLLLGQLSQSSVERWHVGHGRDR